MIDSLLGKTGMLKTAVQTISQSDGYSDASFVEFLDGTRVHIGDKEREGLYEFRQMVRKEWTLWGFPEYLFYDDKTTIRILQLFLTSLKAKADGRTLTDGYGLLNAGIIE